MSGGSNLQSPSPAPANRVGRLLVRVQRAQRQSQLGLWMSAVPCFELAQVQVQVQVQVQMQMQVQVQVKQRSTTEMLP
jgi:hypothetical protein